MMKAMKDDTVIIMMMIILLMTMLMTKLWPGGFLLLFEGFYHRFNVELDLQSKGLLGLHVHSCTLAETPQPPPLLRIWTHIRGRYWSAKIDDLSL